MEIPGLNRLKSPDSQNSIVSATAEATILEPIAAKAGAITDDPVAVRIAQLREQIRLKELAKQTAAVSKPDISAKPSGGVNFSILDQALASHVFEELSDSDEHMEEEEASIVQSSTSSSSDDSADSDDEDDVASITAEERERILIAADDDTTVEVPRTKNEVAEEEEPVKVPDFTIADTDQIILLGTITSVIDRTCVVTGSISSDSKVLDVGSLLVFEDRTNFGYIADTFGPVILPMFSVRFNTTEELQAAGATPNRPVFLVPRYAQYVFSDTLNVKGTDASNIHDEELSEVEFSDDEQEALHKAQKKLERRQNRGDASNTRPLTDLETIAMSQGLEYDPHNHSVHQAPRFDPSPVINTAPSVSQMGRGRGRVQPRGRGRGRGNAFHERANDAQAFKRAFYQEPASADHPTVVRGQPALYQPLQRPL